MKNYKVTYMDFTNNRHEVIINAKDNNELIKIFFENYGGFLLFTEEMKGKLSYE